MDKKPLTRGELINVLQQLGAELPDDEPRKKPKGKLEFMQRFVLTLIIFGISIVTMTLVFNFVLLWNGKMGMSEETVAAFGTIGAAVMAVAPTAYAGLQGIRGWSLNKHVRGKNNIRGEVEDEYQLEAETEQP